jgi:Xaa-Pro aminopeptidase
MNLSAIQSALREQGADAWLFADFRHSDPIAYRILGLEGGGLCTRRWFYLVPAEGEPVKLNHRIEPGKLDSLPGRKIIYSKWQDLHAGLREMVAPYKNVAMQYSPMNNIPYVATVDAGTIELIRSLGANVVSSADLVQIFEARWTPEQKATHLAAAHIVDHIRADAFAEVGRLIRLHGSTDEYTIARYIMDRFEAAGLATHDTPIVGVNENGSDCHYEPAPGRSSPIRRGDWLLIDMWAKEKKPGAVYYDITWCGYIAGKPGDKPSEKHQSVFQVVREARDSAVAFADDAVKNGRAIQGWQVDDVARGVIAKAGYGEYFVHRTGHSIQVEIHANGANMDNLETRDERRIIPWTCFSVEPGIYLPEFGVRLEVNCFVDEKGAGTTGAVQTEPVIVET